MLNVPTRLIETARAKLSSRCGPSRPTTFSPGAIPAQFTSPCRCPNASSAVRTAAAPSASRVTSVSAKRAAVPSSAATRAPDSGAMSATTTRAPAAARPRAVAAPRPEPAPVTMKTRSWIILASPDGSGPPRMRRARP